MVQSERPPSNPCSARTKWLLILITVSSLRVQLPSFSQVERVIVPNSPLEMRKDHPDRVMRTFSVILHAVFEPYNASFLSMSSKRIWTNTCCWRTGLYHICFRFLNITTPTFGDVFRVTFDFEGDHVLSIPVGLRFEEVSQSSTTNQSSLFHNSYHSSWSFVCRF